MPTAGQVESFASRSTSDTQTFGHHPESIWMLCSSNLGSVATDLVVNPEGDSSMPAVRHMQEVQSTRHVRPCPQRKSGNLRDGRLGSPLSVRMVNLRAQLLKQPGRKASLLRPTTQSTMPWQGMCVKAMDRRLLGRRCCWAQRPSMRRRFTTRASSGACSGRRRWRLTRRPLRRRATTPRRISMSMRLCWPSRKSRRRGRRSDRSGVAQSPE